VAIPIGVLFAGALPEPQASNPLAGTGSQEAVTDFHSRLLASLDSLVIPQQRNAEQAVPADGAGQAALVVQATGSALAAGEVVWPECPSCPQRPASGNEWPGPFGEVPGVAVAPPRSGGDETEADAGLTVPLANQELSAGTSAAQGTEGQVAADAEPLLQARRTPGKGLAGVVVVRRPRPAPPQNDGGPFVVEERAFAGAITAPEAPLPADGPEATPGQPAPEVAPGTQASGRDEVPSPGVGSRQANAPPNDVVSTGTDHQPVPVASRADGSLSETAAATLARETGGAAENAEAQRPTRAPVPTEKRVADSPQPTGEAAPLAPGIGHSGSVEPVAPQEAPRTDGEVGVASPAPRQSVPEALVGASAAMVARARNSEGDPAPVEPRGQEAVGMRTGEPGEGASSSGSAPQVSVHDVRNSLPEAREPVEQSHRAEEQRGGEGTRPGQARLAHGGESRRELQAEETSAPWGSRVREAAGVGREPQPGHARRFATRDHEGPVETTAQARPGRAPLEGAGELVARGRLEASLPAIEPGDRDGEAAVVRLEELEEAMPRLVVERARLAHRGEAAELRVRLHPPELGEIRVVFRSEGDELRGAVAVEREEVKAWVEGQAPRWQSELSEGGLRVARLDVALLGRGGASDHGAMAWDGGESPPWGGSPQVGQVPVGAFAQEAEPVEPEFGVNAACSDGRLDYWA